MYNFKETTVTNTHFQFFFSGILGQNFPKLNCKNMCPEFITALYTCIIKQHILLYINNNSDNEKRVPKSIGKNHI